MIRRDEGGSWKVEKKDKRDEKLEARNKNLKKD
jgi:hypothetical protein